MNLATVIVPIYCVLVTMFSGERTTYSPKNMELTGNMPTNSAPNSPMSPRFIDDNTVRRNLLPEFNCETPSPIRGSVESETLCSATEHHRGQNGVTWSAFVRFWICVLLLCAITIVSVYRYFPGYLLLCLTREIMIATVLTVVCAILIGVLWKLRNTSGRQMADNNGTLSCTLCNDRAIPTQQNARMYGAPFGYSWKQNEILGTQRHRNSVNVTQRKQKPKKKCYYCNSEEHLFANCSNKRLKRQVQSNQLNFGRPRY